MPIKVVNPNVEVMFGSLKKGQVFRSGMLYCIAFGHTLTMPGHLSNKTNAISIENGELCYFSPDYYVQPAQAGLVMKVTA